MRVHAYFPAARSNLIFISHYIKKKKKKGSVIRNVKQHIAVKIFDMKFGFGLKYEHFSVPILLIRFLRLHQALPMEGVRLAHEPASHSLNIHIGEQGDVFLHMVMLIKSFNNIGNP